MSGEDELSAAVVELQAYKQRVPSATLLRRFMKLVRCSAAPWAPDSRVRRRPI
jgi:hypothetical protein